MFRIFDGLSVHALPRYFARTYHLGRRSQTPLNASGWHQDALRACTQAIKGGLTQFGLQVPNDGTKHSLLIRLIEQLNPPRQNPSASRIVVLCIGLKDAEKLQKEINRQFPDLTVELQWKERRKTNGNADMYLAISNLKTVQSDLTTPERSRHLEQCKRKKLADFCRRG
jgi:hypothetical protein